MHAAARAGCPTLVVAVLTEESDQPFWGARLVAAKLAPASFTAAGLSQRKLAAALRTCLTDAPLRARAAEAGKALRKEDGAAAAAQFFLRAAAAAAAQ